MGFKYGPMSQQHPAAHILFHRLKLLRDLGLEESQKYIVVEKNWGFVETGDVSSAFQFKEGGGVFGGDGTEF